LVLEPPRIADRGGFTSAIAGSAWRHRGLGVAVPH
jgi:hypothetical protein